MALDRRATRGPPASQIAAQVIGKRTPVRLAYTIAAPDRAYREQPFTVTLASTKGEPLATSAVAIANWTVPIDLELGAT